MTEERIVEKVRKLLALSKSDNPNEAAAALAKAVKLAEEHRLSLARLELEEPSEDPVIVDVVRRPARWKQVLCDVLADANRCQACWINDEVTVVFVGHIDDIEAAKAMFAHVTALLLRLSRRLPRSMRRSFLWGAAVGIQQQIVDAKARVRRAYSGTTALAVVDERAEKVAQMLSHIPNRMGKRGSEGPGYEQGYMTGKRIPLARGQLE